MQLSGTRIQGCIACYKCFENKDQRCAVDSDPANAFIEKMLNVDGMILGSPTYVWDVTAEMKALIDRATFVSIANGDMFQGKVGAAGADALAETNQGFGNYLMTLGVVETVALLVMVFTLINL